MEETKKTVGARARKGAGSVTFKEDDSFEFKPYGEGASPQKNVKKARKSKLYETEGEKQASIVAHLVADKKSIDPVGDMLDDFCQLMRKEEGMEEKMPDRPKTLLDEKNIRLQMWKKRRQLVLTLTVPMEKYQDITNDLCRVISLVPACIRKNEKEIEKYV